MPTSFCLIILSHSNHSFTVFNLCFIWEKTTTLADLIFGTCRTSKAHCFKHTTNRNTSQSNEEYGKDETVILSWYCVDSGFYSSTDGVIFHGFYRIRTVHPYQQGCVLPLAYLPRCLSMSRP